MTNNGPCSGLFADLELARRLERAEAQSNIGFVQSHARFAPESGACWIEVAGASAMYDGANSPATQTFGLGLFQKPTSAALDLLEDFYRQRGAAVHHEVCPLADLETFTLLARRGYYPIEFTSVLYRSIHDGLSLNAPRKPDLRVRLAEGDEQEVWARTAAQGWSDSFGASDALNELCQLSARRPEGYPFLAEIGGKPIATGYLNISGGVAHLAGASTIPEGRRQGAQLALLEARLRFAVERGCTIALMGAQPGSASQRNAERQGFRIAYTRIKWQLA